MAKIFVLATIIFLISFTFLLPSAYSLSPIKQLRAGIMPGYVECKDGLQLILKIDEKSTACVKPETLEILIERGWGLSLKMKDPINTIKITNTESFLDYSIIGGEILSVELISGISNSLEVSLITTSDGEMTIKFPEFKLDEGCSRSDFDFGTIGKREYPYGRFDDSTEELTFGSPDSPYLKIKFLHHTKKIEIYTGSFCYGMPGRAGINFPTQILKIN
jgi:hypothetical protein